ncbi:MAG TPA: poly-gamma-glutamate synthase PgsB [bacterium]|nr:poly-gamma-glutamate synthase PgsB [bacterium]HNT64780.1 poly-gamma-glutamate synthase PgsB [bacterium]HOX85941.1 poly-gamma-glutamate synthase PgsB [bacterium]HPG45076.1 poly-gamma-glutamate synthase PgsB [bacterium]HPM97318.1 poly-gamma-glutamate synthase PgsB [bacterium]
MFSILIPTGGLVLLLAYFGWEKARHERHLNRIPLRILVTGTRGKSSITRLISAGLRAGDIRTTAKTSGSATCYIHPDGRETVVARKTRADLREQLAVIRQASREGAEALVIEGMSLRPQLQRVESQQIIKPHITVLARIGPDHLDIMGPDPESVAAVYGDSLCSASHVFALTDNYQSIVQKACEKATASLILVRPQESIPAESTTCVYIEHPDNYALALAVCRCVGLDEEQALKGFTDAQPDSGALRIVHAAVSGLKISYIHAFAANDPQSIAKIWNLPAVEFLHRNHPTVVLVNTRADRADRTRQMAELLNHTIAADLILLAGNDSNRLLRHLRQDLRPNANSLFLQTLEQLVQVLKPLGHDVCLFGMGNIEGVGHQLLGWLAEKNEPSAEATRSAI